MAGLILAGDVGGTKTELGLYQVAAGRALQLVCQHRYSTLQFKTLEDTCVDFLSDGVKVDAACLGVPGPIIDGVAQATNVPWVLSQAKLSAALGGTPVRLINDLAATAYGVMYLTSTEVAVLHPAENPPAHGNIAVLAAGTGLGESALVYENGSYYAVASEGGHVDFAPRGEEQIELLRHLEKQFGHVSYERVLSGPGIANIYRFLRDRSRIAEPAWLTDQIATGDHAAAVSDAALKKSDPVCVHALEMFCDIYGAEAANLALKVLAFGGVFLGGGIAPKILPMLTGGAFVKAFLSKGRLNEILKRMEVRVALNPAAGLIGAAHRAAAML
ncbi:MAG: glucokinase [Candidatus Binatus sp.]|uniref:glucokinase n=1 Tax=Candidatus Binatus sp. TaxID=2811406 RepID=UPI002723C5C8|nr:glucokinase [Candidatus Binatus sp.]MDO8432563.1 glucokinase [Candidatus Binatus sp.]